MGLTFMLGRHKMCVDAPTYDSPWFGVNIAVIGSAETGYPDVETTVRQDQAAKGTRAYLTLFHLDNPSTHEYE